MLNKSTALLSKKENQWWTHTVDWRKLNFESPTGKGVSQDSGGIYPSDYVTFYDNSGEALPLVPITVVANADLYIDGGYGRLYVFDPVFEWACKAITIYVSPDGRGYTKWTTSDFDPADGDRGPCLSIHGYPNINSFFPFEVLGNSLGELLIPKSHFYISQTPPPWLVEVKFLVTVDGAIAANRRVYVYVHKWSTAPEDGSDTYRFEGDTDSNGVLTLQIPPMSYAPDSAGNVWGWDAEIKSGQKGTGTGTYTTWSPNASEVLPMELHA